MTKYTVDASVLTHYLARFPDKMVIAARDALNRTMQHGSVVAVSDLSSLMLVDKKSIRKRVGVGKATKRRLNAVIIFRGGVGVNLASFGAKQDAQGVNVQVMGERVIVPHAFVVKNLSGRPTVFLRYGNKDDKFIVTRGRYAGKIMKRGPRRGQPVLRQLIVAQYGPTVAETWEKTPHIADNTESEIQHDLPENLAGQVKRFLKEDGHG